MKMIPFSNKQLQNFSIRIKKFLENAEKYSYEEYFGYALRLALQSLYEENPPVGTIIVLRIKGTEYIIGGRNEVYSKKNASLHADKDAIQKLECLSQDEETYLRLKNIGIITKKDLILKRSIQDRATNTFLVTTLESCASCYETILTHNSIGIKINTICSGMESPHTGSEHHTRSANLPPRWKEIAEEQKITLITLWNKEAQSIAQDMYNPVQLLHEKYYKNNQQKITDIVTNLEKITNK